jgi:hypothetical protein
VLEAVRRLRRHPLLVQELRPDQLVQPPLQGPFIPQGNGLQRVIENSRPRVAPSWARAFAAAKRSNRAISKSCNVVGMALQKRGA